MTLLETKFCLGLYSRLVLAKNTLVPKTSPLHQRENTLAFCWPGCCQSVGVCVASILSVSLHSEVTYGKFTLPSTQMNNLIIFKIIFKIITWIDFHVVGFLADTFDGYKWSFTVAGILMQIAGILPVLLLWLKKTEARRPIQRKIIERAEQVW